MRSFTFVQSWLLTVCIASCTASSERSLVRDADATADARGGSPSAQDANLAADAADERSSPRDGDTGSDERDAAISLRPYPTGPYGAVVGRFLPNLPLEGYLNNDGVGLSDQRPFITDYSLEKLRESGSGYALVHVSAFF
jgi:hypothetical protein